MSNAFDSISLLGFRPHGALGTPLVYVSFSMKMSLPDEKKLHEVEGNIFK